MENIIEHLRKFQGRQYEGLAGLSEAVREVLEVVGIEQRSRLVTEMPTPRTLRYYLAEGLLPPASETRGNLSIFDYRHLLSVIVIKRLQSVEEISIRIIGRVIKNRSVEDLEKLLVEEVRAVPYSVEAIEDANRRGETYAVFEDPEEINEINTWNKQRKTRHSASKPEVWRHYRISEGIEIRFSDDTRLSESDRRDLVQDIARQLKKRFPFAG